MDERSLKTLEFDKITELLGNYVISSLGKEKVDNLIPSSKYEEVIQWQQETDEAATIFRLEGRVPLGGIFDLRPHLRRAEIGGMLNAQELMEVASTIRASRQIKRFIEEMVAEGTNLPILLNLVSKIVVLVNLQTAINRAVDEDGKIIDGASEQLQLLRRQITTRQTRIRERLNSIIRSSNADKMLSEKIITIRNDRYVIPVKQEYRNYYGGVVHDESASGQTLFIEPQTVVQLNNELQHLRVKEQLEIERILLQLTGKVAEDNRELTTIVTILGQLDFVFAKAYFGKSINGSKPNINNDGLIELFKARHPLIATDEVVANDIMIGRDYTTIVITGPNTGGKTVALKTVGLCTLMAQAGLQIPALDGSHVAVFDNVYADIGDEQSIEQSLSTFSSHMVNIVRILNKVNERSLILFDELGAGTDPQEGTALAISILDEVHEIGARVIATTHYPELKAYGYTRKGVVNASVEFDTETLSPTYKLLIGIPGRSNAFEIAQRLGLKETIINKARSYIDADNSEVEQMIISLQKSKQHAEQEEAETLALLRQTEQLHEQLQQKIAEYEDYKTNLYERAKAEANQIVEQANEEAEAIIKQLREMRSHHQSEIKEHELIEAKTRLREVAPKTNEQHKQWPVDKQQQLQVGDEVKVISLNQTGTLLEHDDKSEWTVQVGILKVKVPETDLKYIAPPKQVETTPIAMVRGINHYVSTQLDLRGERYDDALHKLEKYLDDALLAGHAQVTIVHGKGTGALRQGVQSYLKNHRSVKKYRFGEGTEGGTGATIVQLK